ncbi:MAG: hypothetical protein SAK29_38850 [Scytonema sp. PMC 1069.18]|nr:hypothetical protein [Scytonema sp. PMC 1069.18]MEC4885477.1 hypothetical protein [Scytonema sp. PMC 1070.18]
MPQNSITADLQEEIIGQLVVGDRIIKIGSNHGAIVNIATKKEKTTVKLRPTPMLRKEKLLDNLVGRQELVTEAIAALGVGESVEFYSPAGFGKTVLLSSLAQEIQAMSLFKDGVIYLSPVHPYVGDILYAIWEALYETNNPYKPTYTQIFEQIQNKQALVVLDDDDLIREELQKLMGTSGQCTFLIASSTSRICKKGRSIPLAGLSVKSGVALVEKELKRPLTKEELPAAKSLCEILHGHPMHLKIAIATILEEGRSIAEVVSQLPTSEPRLYLIQQILTSLTEPQRTILNLLAVIGKIGLESKQVVRITQIADTLSILETLCKRQLVHLDGSRYKINKSIVEVLPPEWKLTESVDKTIAYFINWIEKYHKQRGVVVEEIDAIVQIIEVAVRNSRWLYVLRLVKAVEGLIALTKRWDLWLQVLRRGQQASQALQDKAAEAWALHQLGTCHLCLEENNIARDYLNQAIQIRESLDDQAGVSATRHNFSLVKETPLSSSAQNKQQEFLKNRENYVEETSGSPDLKTELPSQHLVTRLHIVSDNVSSSARPSSKSTFLLSPTGIITTGIIASGGLLAWTNWHRFIPNNASTSTPQPTTATTQSPITEPTPTADVTASPTPETSPATGAVMSPLPEHTPVVSPPLTPPSFEFQQPKPIPPQKLESKPTPAPTFQPKPTAEPTPKKTTPSPTPTAETTPTPEVTPTVTPTAEATPLPEVTPTIEATPTVEPQAPTVETTPTVESQAPTVEATPLPTFTPYFTPTPTR